MKTTISLIVISFSFTLSAQIDADFDAFEDYLIREQPTYLEAAEQFPDESSALAYVDSFRVCSNDSMEVAGSDGLALLPEGKTHISAGERAWIRIGEGDARMYRLCETEATPKREIFRPQDPVHFTLPAGRSFSLTRLWEVLGQVPSSFASKQEFIQWENDSSGLERSITESGTYAFRYYDPCGYEIVDSVSIHFVELEDPSTAPGALYFKTRWMDTEGDTATYKIAYWSDIPLGEGPKGVEVRTDVSQALGVDNENRVYIYISDTTTLRGFSMNLYFLEHYYRASYLATGADGDVYKMLIPHLWMGKMEEEED